MTQEQQELCRTLRAQYRVNIDDRLADKEIEQCRIERLKTNGNGASVTPESERFCFCAELVVGGRRLPVPPKFHDCEYITKRSQLVPLAIERTNARVVLTTANSSRWTREFNRNMDRLSASLLRSSNNGAGEHRAA